MTHPNQEIIEAFHRGEEIQYRHELPNQEWFALFMGTETSVWYSLVSGTSTYEFRFKPKTVSFPGQKDVPAPLRSAKNQYQYFVLESDGSVHEIIYSETNVEHMNLLKNKAIFSSREAAWLYRDALNNFLRSQ